MNKLQILAAACIAATAVSPCAMAQHSGTVPVMYITSSTPLTSINRETYVSATYYIDNCGVDWATSIGDVDHQLPLQVKGRGNYTWVGFDKKPLRLLLDEPQEMCGLKNSDYFGLFAHADDDLGFMRNLLGFEMARSLNMAWTPSQQPVELYFNGDYRGLYFCTELVRVDPDRVNIYKQPDNDPTDPTGGWLCEIDNYDTDPHITLTEGNGQKIIISRKTPLSLCGIQETFLRDQMIAINQYVYSSTKSNCIWSKLVDLEELAKFYIVNEVMDDYESFHGSCLLHRDRGADSKWKFGPVWDFGSSFKRGQGKFIWKDAKWSQIWIGEMYKFPEFQEVVKKVWAEFCANEYDKIEPFLTSWIELIRDAAASDYARWPNYGNNDLDADLEDVLFRVRNKSRWLGMQWGTAPDDIPYVVANDVYLRGQFNGWGTDHKMTQTADGNYTITVPDLSGTIKVADVDWSSLIYGGNGTTKLKCGQTYKLVSGTGSSNIEIYGGIKNAVVTFNPAEETLLITGDYYAIEGSGENPTYQIYFRGDINSWGKQNPLTLDADGIYRCEVSNLTKRFKIADDGYTTINLGGDGKTLCTPGIEYKLVKKGSNITMAEDVAKALVEVDIDNLTVLISEIREMSEITNINDDHDRIRLFNMQGIEVSPSSSLAPGIYIEIKGESARKVRK